MNILYVIANNHTINYLCDSILCGLVELGHNVTETSYIWYADNNEATKERLKEECNSHWGRCFTYSLLYDKSRENIDRSNIEERIRDHEFDLVIYGEITRCKDYLDTVCKYYRSKEIVLIDGEDDSCVHNYGFGIYFKRELYNIEILTMNDVHPIQFAMPTCKVLNKYNVPKTQLFAHINPDLFSTFANEWHSFTERYEFDNEQDYYHEYQISLFGITYRKGGWDSLRHYEIIANGCLPYFPRYNECPKSTMVFWPTLLQLETNTLAMYAYYKGIDSYFDETYTRLLMSWHNYLIEYLTCDKIAKYMLDCIANSKNRLV